MSWQLLEFHAFYFYPVSSHNHVSILRLHPSSVGVLTFSLYIFSNKQKPKSSQSLPKFLLPHWESLKAISLLGSELL